MQARSLKKRSRRKELRVGKKIMENLKSKKPQNEESAPALPSELIMEILSRLPIKHLSQVQVVSKEWQALIDNHFMIQKHMAHSPVLRHWHNEYTGHGGRTTTPDKKDVFCFKHGCDGIILILNRTSNKHILWNPAIRRLLELPDPHEANIGLALLYAPTTRDYRVVSFYHMDKKSASGVGCEILTPGPSMSWKPLEFPDVPNPKKVVVIPTGGDVHCVLTTKGDDGSESGARMIVTFDVEAESFTVNRLDGVGVATAVLNWDGKLGVVKVEGETLEVIKLEDYKRRKWSTKTIIPLPFVNKPGYEGSVRPLFNRGGDIWFWLEGKEIFSYDVETGKTGYVKTSKYLCYENEQIYSYKQSLVSFEGMQPDTDSDLVDYRPS